MSLVKMYAMTFGKHETANIKPDIDLIFGKSADNLEVNISLLNIAGYIPI